MTYVYNFCSICISNNASCDVQRLNGTDSCIAYFENVPVSSEISDFTPRAHAQSNIPLFKYAENWVCRIGLQKEK